MVNSSYKDNMKNKVTKCGVISYNMDINVFTGRIDLQVSYLLVLSKLSAFWLKSSWASVLL